MKDYKEILQNNIKIIEHYGIKAQIPIWIEEMSELTKNLCKWLRNYDKLNENINLQLKTDIEEEIADVTICLDQLKYSIQYAEDNLIAEYNYKINRQLERIKNEG